MSTRHFVNGLLVLCTYMNTVDGHWILSADDKVSFMCTDKPVNPHDVAYLHQMGWYQEDENWVTIKEYDPDLGWYFLFV